MTVHTKPQIVHESSTQRQHARVGIPARVDIDGNTYPVSNLSVGGLAVVGLLGEVETGDTLAVTIRFPFEGFDFSMDVICEVRFHMPDRSVTGMQFVQISRPHLSLLHFAIDAFLSGEMVDAGDLLAIVQRENYTTPRNVATVANDETRFAALSEFAKRRGGAIALLIFAGILLAFIVANMLTRALVVQAEGTVASLRTLTARAPLSAALVANAVPVGTRVAPNTIIATLEAPGGQLISVVGGCDCLVTEQLAEGGAFLTRGAPVARLVPAVSTNRALLAVPLEDLRRVRVGDRVTARFYDAGAEVVGTVEQVNPPNLVASNANGRPAAFESAAGTVKVKLQNSLPARRVGQPISARIRVSRLEPFA